MSDSNSKNNNSQVLKIHEWIWGDVYELGKVSETMTCDRYYWVNFFPIHIQDFMSDSNSENNNLQGFKNSQKVLRESVWAGESFLNHDKWHIKLLSEFFPNSHSTFYEWLQLRK